MPVQPVWWLDDAQAAALPDDLYNELIEKVKEYNDNDQSEQRILAKKVKDITDRAAKTK
jgi:hypothetical protein